MLDCARATERLRAALAEEALVPAVAAEFGELPFQPAAIQLAAVAESVTGRELRRTLMAAEVAGVLPKLGAWCRSRRYWRRLFAVNMLARFGMDERLLLDLLGDPKDVVRAAAAGAATSNPTPAVARRLLVMLDDPAPLVRSSTQAALYAPGQVATADLLEYISDPESPRVAAALDVARVRAEPAFLPAALALRSFGLSPDGLRELAWAQRAALSDEVIPVAGGTDESDRSWEEAAAVRAAAGRLLAAIGGEDAATSLADLLDDPARSVRIAAAEGLGRLGALRQGGSLVQALEDPVWDVRRAAAEALQGMGAIGRSYLRSARRHGGAGAAAIAGMALGRPVGPVEAV